ncbi:MAG TPA: glycosyltransferase [Chloroflexota bacterium]|nr:glycosyltransferase [Chloroflexota bacterium]
MRFNWFSPLPPSRTDIANYTARVLPALAREAEVVLWTDQEEWDPALERHARVQPFRPDRIPWPEINRGDVCFYNLGNNAEFHLAIFKICKLHPGVVILHDFCLQEFFAYYYRWLKGDQAGYVEQMARYYGEVGRRDAELWWNDRLDMPYLVERYPLTPLALANALGVVVHTEQALAFARGDKYAIASAPLPYPASNLSARPLPLGHCRARHPPYTLVVFGFIHRNRRLESLFRALAGMPEKHQFRLDIYGELWDPAHVQSQVEDLGLGEIVTINGFVSEPELDAALSAADLAVNLRYPSMGEASGSQLRIWDHALPTLVTRVGMYASLPDATVAFVRPEHEIEDLQFHLRAFLGDPSRFIRMGENGRHRLERQHAPTSYARILGDFARHVEPLRRRVLSQQMTEMAGEQLAAWIEPTGSDQAFRRLAEEIRSLLA